MKSKYITQEAINKNVISSCMIEFPPSIKPNLITTVLAMRAKRFPSKRKKKERGAHGYTKKV